MKLNLIVILSIYTGIITAQYQKLMDFSGGLNGANPWKTSLVYDGTFLFGLTEFGGIHGQGNIFKIKPDGSSYTNIFDFDTGNLGIWPLGSLTKIGDTLYGTSSMGGANNMGTVFKINTDGTGSTNLYSFLGPEGGYSQGTLISDETFLYGTTTWAGNGNSGVIFRIKPNGTNFSNTMLFDIQNTGTCPGSSLFYDGTFLYGLSMSTSFHGNVYKIKTDGTGFQRLGPNDGGNAQGGLISDGIFLYGMTPIGGVNGMGNIFKIKPDGTDYSFIHSFTGTNDGSEPLNDLLLVGTDLYGMTTSGGMSDQGVLFKIKTDGSGFVRLVDFNGSVNGSHPRGSLITDGDYLYGMTTEGGAFNKGTIFRYLINPLMAGEKELQENDISIFPNPSNGQLIINGITDFLGLNIKAVDVLGQEVTVKYELKAQKLVLSLEELKNGTYFIQISRQNKPILNRKILLLNTK